MQSLKNYLRQLPVDEQRTFALRAGTTVGYLRKAISIRQQIGEKLCSRLEHESGGAITRRDLRPNDWQVIWPELAEFAQNDVQTLATQAPAAINNDLQEVVHG